MFLSVKEMIRELVQHELLLTHLLFYDESIFTHHEDVNRHNCRNWFKVNSHWMR